VAILHKKPQRRDVIEEFCFDSDTKYRYYFAMKRKHQKTLELIFSRPVSANVRWSDIETLLLELGAQIEERDA
jgi:hypothetical protein